MNNWTQFLSALTLALVRISGMIVFAPFFASTALPVRTKAAFAGAMAFLLAPLVASLPNARAEISFSSLLGELAIGLVYGLSLALLNEMLLFAGQIAGLQFSFSLVNLLDPASSIQTPLLGDLFQLMGLLVLITAGLDRILLASMARSGGHLSRLHRTGCTGARRNLAGRDHGGSPGQTQPAIAGDGADGSTQNHRGICHLNRRSGALAAVHRGTLRQPARYGGAAHRHSCGSRCGRVAMPGERTEQATPHRRERARKEGDILHSRELTAAAGALAGVLALGSLGIRALEA